MELKKYQLFIDGKNYFTRGLDLACNPFNGNVLGDVVLVSETLLKKEIDEKVLPIFSKCKVIDFAVIAFFAGVGEELFFRGWMQAVLAERSGVVVGILITSVIFGLLHYLSTTYAVYAFITGIYLGVIYYASGNLYIVMAIHAIYDFVALVYLVKKGKKETGDGSFVTDKISGES